MFSTYKLDVLCPDELVTKSNPSSRSYQLILCFYWKSVNDYNISASAHVYDNIEVRMSRLCKVMVVVRSSECRVRCGQDFIDFQVGQVFSLSTHTNTECESLVVTNLSGMSLNSCVMSH